MISLPPVYQHVGRITSPWLTFLNSYLLPFPLSGCNIKLGLRIPNPKRQGRACMCMLVLTCTRAVGKGGGEDARAWGTACTG